MQESLITLRDGSRALYFRANSYADWRESMVRDLKAANITYPLRAYSQQFAQGTSAESLAAFRAAQGKIQRPLIPGHKKSPAVCGGAWVVPSVLASNPLAARRREPSKLPPLNVRVRLNTNAHYSAEEINIAAAKLARGLWEYKLAGGIASLTLYYLSAPRWKFAYSGKGASYLRVDIPVPLTDEAALAYALSGFSYRELYISWAAEIFGSLSIPPGRMTMDKDVLWLSPPEVDATLKAFGLIHEGETA